MHRVGLEPSTTIFKREKTIHALDCPATVKGGDNIPFIFVSRNRGIILIFTLYAIRPLQMVHCICLQHLNV
jgi:hypothetical protein